MSDTKGIQLRLSIKSGLTEIPQSGPQFLCSSRKKYVAMPSMEMNMNRWDIISKDFLPNLSTITTVSPVPMVKNKATKNELKPGNQDIARITYMRVTSLSIYLGPWLFLHSWRWSECRRWWHWLHWTAGRTSGPWQSGMASGRPHGSAWLSKKPIFDRIPVQLGVVAQQTQLPRPLLPLWATPKTSWLPPDAQSWAGETVTRAGRGSRPPRSQERRDRSLKWQSKGQPLECWVHWQKPLPGWTGVGARMPIRLWKTPANIR